MKTARPFWAHDAPEGHRDVRLRLDAGSGQLRLSHHLPCLHPHPWQKRTGPRSRLVAFCFQGCQWKNERY